jgi:hypothetical protein
MKTKQFLFFGLVCLSTQFTNAQATVANATNTTTATSYLGSGASSNFDVLFKRNNVSAGLLGTTKTAFGVNALAMLNSVSIGVSAGQFSSGIGGNTFVGQNAGKGNSLSILNSGVENTFIGYESGRYNINGIRNTSLGVASGQSNNSGNFNVNIGFGAGNSNNSGNYNTYIGYGAACEEYSTGSGNVFIGALAGFSTNPEISNQLVIGNFENNQLISGDFLASTLKLNGKVGIGGTALTYFGNFPITSGAVNNVANYNLFVKGGILTEEVRVSLATTWADYVFSKDYKMPTLPELEKQIQAKGHLPNMPSAQEVKDNGIELGEMAKMQQEKIEELTLYIIQINKELQELKAKSKN